MAWAAAGLFLSDRAEEAFGLVPTDKDKQKLQETVPKIQFVEGKK